MKVAIGSKNPAKVKAVREAYGKAAEIMEVETSSGVSEQPFSDEETIEGAVNRAAACLKQTDALFGIGLEGGVVQTKYGLFLCNWGALADRDGNMFIAGGARVLLPDEIAKRMVSGEELGPVMDDFTKKEGIRKQEGAIGVFTKGRITRAEMFGHIMEMLIGQYEYNKAENSR